MLKIFRSSFALLALCGVTCFDAAAQNAPSGQTVAPAGNINAVDSSQMGIRVYRLGPGDLLDLRVFAEPQFDSTLEVNSDGEIFIPFVEASIKAQCRTVDEVRADIIVGLAKLLRKPKVSLLVKEKRSRTPAVLYGSVRVPQQFQMYRRARLLELVGYAGGFTEQASGTIMIYHTEPILCPEPGEVAPAIAANTTEPGDLTQLPFDVYNISDLKAGKAEANPVIRPGDVVRIDEAAPVYVTGAVMQPQGIYHRGQLTLMRALAQVGGLRSGAKSSAVRIYRQKPDGSDVELLTVNYSNIRKQKEKDVLLQPYDIVDVGEANAFSKEQLPKTLLNFASGGLSNALTTLPVRVLY